MKKLALIGVVITSLITGCAILKGNKDIKEIRMEYDIKANVNYGSSIPVDFYAIYSDGKQKKISNKNELIIQVIGGQYADGNVVIESRPTSLMNDFVQISASYLTESDTFKISKTIPYNYKGDLVLPFGGTHGIDGEEGDGKSTPLIWRDGKDGENGLDGTNGGNGSNISARIWKELSGDFYRVEITDLDINATYHYRYKNLGYGIQFHVHGGNGGNGGDGGKGGNGKDGEVSEDKVKTPGDAGNGGNGGRGGSGGNGGSVFLYLHPNAAQLKEKITFQYSAGSAGLAGKKGIAGRTGDPDTGQEPAKEGVDGIDGEAGIPGQVGQTAQLIIEHFDIE